MINPFRETIVANPWKEAQRDVAEIHGDVFQKCLHGIEAVRATGSSKGLLIHGEAGSGKTHLLGRLRQWLVPQLPSATDREETLFIWVRLQTSPRMIWRTMRRTLVDDWFRKGFGGHHQFQRILFHRLAEYRPAEWDLEPWYEYMLDEQPAGLIECLDRIADELELDWNTARAFQHIAFKRHLRDLHAWLAGNSLPETALKRMEFTQDEGTDEEREDEARRVVLMLCRLAGNGLPIVMGFDQVEALQLRPGDTEALFAFGQLISALHDHASNLLLISCVQSAFATELQDHIRSADHDRMTELGSLSLDPLTRQQAEMLLASRLEGVESEPAPWPLTSEELDALLAPGTLTPRRLLNRAAEKFDDLKSGKTSDPSSAGDMTEVESQSEPVPTADRTESFLSNEWETVFESRLSENTPDQTEGIVRQALPLLTQIVAPELELVRDDEVLQHALADVQLIFEDGQRNRSGVSICTQSNMTSLAASFRRLLTQFSDDKLKNLAIIRDSRVPISEGAKKTREQLDKLQQRGARVVYPTKEALVALDALRGLLSDAKSGDLAFGDQVITPETVEAWLRAHLMPSLQSLVDDVFEGSTGGVGEGPSDAQDIEVLSALLTRDRVVTLDKATKALRKSTDEVSHFIERHPGHFRLLGDPPTVVFEAVEASGRR